MVFKRPGNSRDDKSNSSPNKFSKGDNSSKKPYSSTRGKSSPSSFNKPDSDRPKRSYNSEGGDEKKSFSPRNKSYSDRPSSDERPKSSFNRDSAGGKKNFSAARSKPYSGRPDADDRPKRTFGGDSGEKKPFSSSRSKPYSGRPDNEERPRRTFGGDSGEKKSFSSSRSKPYSGRSNEDDRPKRTFNAESSGERKFGAKPGSRGAERSGDRKFAGKSSDDKGFRKRTDDFKDKPFRRSESSGSDRPSPGKTERRPDAPERVLRGRKKTIENDDKGLIRLNRYISNAGICSRRKADELISAGVVSVNGEVVSELGYKVDPQKDVIRYNGEQLKREKMVYVLLNKPKDYITTTEDPQERRTVMHLVEKASKERIYPIGRLDRNTTGLLLMTNDGDLADKLSHPKNNVTKLYHVELNKSLTQGDLNKIGFGLELEDGFIKPDSVSYVQGGTKKEIGIQIHSGKNRIVRRIFEHLGYDVVKLDRAVYANLTKKDLPRGRWRYLDEQEVIQLKHLI